MGQWYLPPWLLNRIDVLSGAPPSTSITFQKGWVPLIGNIPNENLTEAVFLSAAAAAAAEILDTLDDTGAAKSTAVRNGRLRFENLLSRWSMQRRKHTNENASSTTTVCPP